MIKSKHCYDCKIKYPLFMFQKQTGFSVASCLGKVYVCKICNFKKSKHRVVRQLSNGKFVVIQLTLKERIKELFK